METLGGIVVVFCLWFAQGKPEDKKVEIRKKPNITVEIVLKDERRNKKE